MAMQGAREDETTDEDELTVQTELRKEPLPVNVECFLKETFEENE